MALLGNFYRCCHTYNGIKSHPSPPTTFTTHPKVEFFTMELLSLNFLPNVECQGNLYTVESALPLVQLSINSTLSNWKNRKDKSCFSKQLIKKLIDHCIAVVHLPLYRNFPGLKMLYLYYDHLVLM